MPQEELKPLREDLAPKEDPASAFVTRYVKRDVKLIAYTATEIQVVSTSNAKSVFYWSCATFLFGIFACEVTRPDVPEFAVQHLLKFPYILGIFGLMAAAAAAFELRHRYSLLNQINQETSTTAGEKQ